MQGLTREGQGDPLLCVKAKAKGINSTAPSLLFLLLFACFESDARKIGEKSTKFGFEKHQNRRLSLYQRGMCDQIDNVHI